MADIVKPGTVGVVLNSNRSQVLLHLRNDRPMWSLPGGAPDFGESFESATIREIREETGIIAEIDRLIGVFSDPMSWIVEYPDGNRVHEFAAAFECHSVGGELGPLAADSIDANWFDVDALPDNLMNLHFEVIEKALTVP